MWTKFYEKNKSQVARPNIEINLSELQEQITMTDTQSQINALVQKVEELSIELSKKTEPKVEVHKNVEVNVTDPKDVSLLIYKSLPEFCGEREQYATWRTTTKTAIKLLAGHEQSMRYYEALMVVRNKITGAASNILNNYNTVFNFEAIIDRLDFTYADKRPLYVLEQELLVLQQDKLSLDEFYDKVNEKLNSIVNKINMTYKEKVTANAFIEGANEKALRTFITGLNNRKGEILYASNPKSLPEAYARLQTIINDQSRIDFARRYNRDNVRDTNHQLDFQTKNPQFKFRESNQRQSFSKANFQSNLNQPVPMEVEKSSTRVNIERKSNPSNGRYNPNQTFKRELRNDSNSSSEQHKKFQRVNNINSENEYAATIVQDHQIDGLSDDECAEKMSNISSTDSIFLGV